MKTYGKLIIGAILLGTIFAFLFYRDIKAEVNDITNEAEKLYLFQVGVFASEANALNYAQNFASEAIINIDEYYRVLTCVTPSKANKEKLYNYYQKQKINFYIKELPLTTDMADKLTKADQLLAKTDANAAINELCEEMLKTFVTYSK